MAKDYDNMTLEELIAELRIDIFKEFTGGTDSEGKDIGKETRKRLKIIMKAMRKLLEDEDEDEQ